MRAWRGHPMEARTRWGRASEQGQRRRPHTRHTAGGAERKEAARGGAGGGTGRDGQGGRGASGAGAAVESTLERRASVRHIYNDAGRRS